MSWKDKLRENKQIPPEAETAEAKTVEANAAEAPKPDAAKAVEAPKPDAKEAETVEATKVGATKPPFEAKPAPAGGAKPEDSMKDRLGAAWAKLMPGSKEGAKPGSAAKAAVPAAKLSTEERLTELEGKQQRMAKIGGAAAIVAALAALAALALGIVNQQDAASKDDVDELTEKVNELGASLKAGTEKQLKGLSGRIDTVEQGVASVRQTQATTAEDIAKLRTQVTAAANANAAAAATGATAGGAATGAGADTTTGGAAPAVPGSRP